MARKNMYIRDDAATAAKRGRVGGEYNPYAAAPAASPVPSYYTPAPVRSRTALPLLLPIPGAAPAFSGSNRPLRFGHVRLTRNCLLSCVGLCAPRSSSFSSWEAHLASPEALPAAGAGAAKELRPSHKHKGQSALQHAVHWEPQ